ncbi:hypothetical protein NliqN6_3645 [Naganishia liquefaciens]|uniref:Uncharacterized protein n=1 Tax=Naganishia liquefaciens TaxID=104408 RepID=A0A8H3TUQ2_9TREE|nr:hypothetical protein NliqN6_3645 [Naganishia liquefaciens]
MTEVRQKQLADMDLSAKRPTPRTYGKVRTMQTNKLSRKIGDEEERSSNYVGSDPALHTKRKADSQTSALDSAKANSEKSKPVQYNSKPALFERNDGAHSVARKSIRNQHSAASNESPTESVAIDSKSGEAKFDAETSLRPRRVAVQQKNGRNVSKNPFGIAPEEASAFPPPFERPVKQTPKVQEDLFYVQPTNSITFDESPPREPDSELRQTGCSVRQRDVRFSSPLDSHQPKHAAEKIKKSNPRKGTAASSAPNRSRADLSDSYRELASKKGPTVIVYPPFTVEKSSQVLAQPNVSADQFTLDPKSSTASEVSVTSGPLPVEPIGTSAKDVQPGLLSLGHLRKAPIDRTIQIDLENGVVPAGRHRSKEKLSVKDMQSRPTNVKATNNATKKSAEDRDLAVKTTGVVSRKDPMPAHTIQEEEEADRCSLPTAVQKRKRASISTEPNEATERTESRKKRRGLQREHDTASSVVIRGAKSVKKPTLNSVQREAEPRSKENRLALPEDSDEDRLTEEEVDMRELVMEIYKVTWQATRDSMQAPIRECSLAQERLAEHVVAVLRDVLAETQQIVDLWNEARQTCYETIAAEIQPAVLKLEEENDLTFARFRDVCEAWSTRRLRVPRQILDWTQE